MRARTKTISVLAWTIFAGLATSVEAAQQFVRRAETGFVSPQISACVDKILSPLAMPEQGGRQSVNWLIERLGLTFHSNAFKAPRSAQLFETKEPPRIYPLQILILQPSESHAADSQKLSAASEKTGSLLTKAFIRYEFWPAGNDHLVFMFWDMRQPKEEERALGRALADCL
jgi:hypothetical protein